jgi:hypothetical protein
MVLGEKLFHGKQGAAENRETFTAVQKSLQDIYCGQFINHVFSPAAADISAYQGSGSPPLKAAHPRHQ